MQTDNAKQKLFSDIVNKAIALSRQLSSALDNEFEALASNSPERLEKTVAEKKQFLVQLGNVLAEQNSLLCSMDLTLDDAGVQRLYASLVPEHPARKAWKTLQTLAKNLAEQNLRNGVMLSQCTNRTRNALDILTGQRYEKPVYQYGGKTEGYRQSRSLAIA
ncbi:MAG: flagellar protein FlgN [Chromatiales bacterium]|jgi:flagellar biosynthesis/type III secretory pathway chaperone